MTTRHPKLLIALLFTGVLMGALDLAIIGPALPAIQADFGMGERQLPMLFNAYVLCQIVGTPLLAKMSDRFGARAIYILAIALFALGSLLIVLAANPMTLYIGRGVQGFGAGGIFPVAAAVIGAVLPPKKRGPALGLIGIVFGLAFLLGPVLGGIFLRFSWQWLFLINLPIAALLVAGALWLLPSEGAGKAKPFDYAGALTIVVTLTALVLALNSFDGMRLAESLRSPLFLPCLLIFAAGTFWFLKIEQRAADPILRPEFFASRQISAACMIALAVGAVQSGSVFYPLLAVSALDVTPANASLLMLPSVLASTVTSPVAGRMLNTVGSRGIVFASLMLVYLSVMAYGLLELNAWLFVAAGIVSGIGMAGLLGAPLRFAILNETTPRDRGATQGLLSISFSIGRLLGAALVGGIAASHGGGVFGYQEAFLFMGIPAAAAVFIATRLKSKRAEEKAAERIEGAAQAA